MKLVTQTDVLSARMGDASAVTMICKSGFDGIDYSMFAMKEDDCILNSSAYEKHVTELKRIAEGFGKSFEQSHAPFPPCIQGNKEYNRKMMERTKRAIEIAGMLDAKICVVHPVHYTRDQLRKNIAMYLELEPYAEKYGVKIALENMWGHRLKKIIPNVCSVADDFNAHLDALNRKNFTACLDLGHCGLVGEDAATMIRKMGHNRIGCLHIHDNDFVSDSHTLPYTMKMDWQSIITALGEIDYQGNFTYEADMFMGKFPTDLAPACMKFMCEVGRSMMKKIESCRK